MGGCGCYEGLKVMSSVCGLRVAGGVGLYLDMLVSYRLVKRRRCYVG